MKKAEPKTSIPSSTSPFPDSEYVDRPNIIGNLSEVIVAASPNAVELNICNGSRGSEFDVSHSLFAV